MIVHYGTINDTRLTPKQLAAHILADFGPYFCNDWRHNGCWPETAINMTDLEKVETDRQLQIYIKRTFKLLNLKELG